MNSAFLNTKKLYYITTPIFYVNASPHVGHLYSALLADVQCRWKLLKGVQEPFLSTGTDEHGIKIQKQAIIAGKNCNEFCDGISARFRNLFDLCDIKYNDYIRTTEERHRNSVTTFWNLLHKNGFIYKSTYEGWYSINDENFLSNNDIEEKIDEKTGEKTMVSKESGHLVEILSEVNYLFRLSEFKDKLKEYLNKSVILPNDKYKQYLFDHIDTIKDLSVSRESKRVSWGIQVPNDSTQIIYVWLDALVNYLTVAGYPDKTDKMEKLWPPDCHVCGKDIIKFHAIYWPAFLFAANLEPPKNILCHGHFLMDGRKMSKSVGNVIDPFDFQSKYTTDGIRYILIRDGIPSTDNNINLNSVLLTINAELSNTFGNLFQRCAAEGINPRGVYPCFIEIEAYLNEDDKKLIEKLDNLRVVCNNHYESFDYYEVIHKVMGVLRDLNLLVHETKPWVLVKDEKKLNELNKIFFLTFECLRISSILLNPIVPNLTNKLLDYLNADSNLRNYENAMVDIKRTKTKYIILNSNRNVLFKRLA